MLAFSHYMRVHIIRCIYIIFRDYIMVIFYICSRYLLWAVGYEILDLKTAWTNGRRLKKYTYSGAAKKLKL